MDGQYRPQILHGADSGRSLKGEPRPRLRPGLMEGAETRNGEMDVLSKPMSRRAHARGDQCHPRVHPFASSGMAPCLRVTVYRRPVPPGAWTE
jgi:hypothetical protein